MPTAPAPWIMPFHLGRRADAVLVRLEASAIDHPWMRQDGALAWIDPVPGRVVVECGALAAASSTLLGWLLRLVDRVGVGMVELRSANPVLANQLRAVGLDRLAILAA